MKSEQNFSVIKQDGTIIDMHEIGVWVESFHIHSPNIYRNKLKIPNMPGAYLANSTEEERKVSIVMQLESENLKEFDQLKHQIYDVFFSEEDFTIIRELTPDREIHVLQEGDFDIANITPSDGYFEIELTMLDPYVYSKEKSAIFPSDAVRLTNHGTAEADPIFELEVLQPVTFAMIQNHKNEYQMIGRPVNEDGFQQIVDSKISKLKETGSTLNTWSVAPHSMVDTNFIDNIGGKMTSDGAGIRADGYGTGDRIHGPAIFKELPQSIQDFEIESTFDIISRRPEENWRMGIYFHDENMNNLGHLGIKDNSRLYRRRVGLGRAGHYRGGGPENGNVIGDSSWINNNAREVTLMYLRVKREGQTYSFYIGEWQNRRHIHSWEGVYRDINNQFQGKLKYITLFIGKFQDRPNPGRLRINSVEVFELRTVTEDQTPYIAYPGDIITFDHKDAELLINGEDRTDLKDFGGKYFKLAKGQNQLVVQPSNCFKTSVKYRERFR